MQKVRQSTAPSRGAEKAREGRGLLSFAHKLLGALLAVLLAAAMPMAARADNDPVARGLAAKAFTTASAIGPALRQQGYYLACVTSKNLANAAASPLSSLLGSLHNGVTGMVQDACVASGDKLLYVFGNWYGSGAPAAEIPNNNDILVDLGVFNGSGQFFPPDMTDLLRIAPRQIATVSVQMPVTANATFSEQFYCGLTGSVQTCPANMQVVGNTSGQTTTSPEGAFSEDGVRNLQGFGNCCNTVYGPSAVLLHTTNNTYVPSIASAGDSIDNGKGDSGGDHAEQSGWIERYAAGTEATKSVQLPISSPRMGFIQAARPSQTASNFLTAGQHERTVDLACLATNVVDDMGTNDVAASATLATLKSNQISEALLFLTKCGTPYVRVTLLPKTSSTNGWTTIGGQSTIANETVRTGDNDWLRDTSASGFLAQAKAACLTSTPCAQATSNSPILQLFDADAAVECNSSNVPTLDAGLWCVSGTAASVYSGSITSGASQVGWTDSALGGTSNTYRGDVVVMTSGAASGQAGGVALQTSANALSIGALGTLPSTGDTYQVWYGVPSPDGVHPSTYSVLQIDAALDAAVAQGKLKLY